MKVKFILFSISLFFSSFSYSWQGPLEVNSLEVSTAYYYLHNSTLGTSSELSTPCESKNWVAIPVESPTSSQIFSLLLAANMSGKKVKVHLTGACTGSGTSGYAELVAVQIHRDW